MRHEKILFLDLDSVMIVWDWNHAEPRRNKFDMLPFTKECVEALNEIIEKTDCEIVLSSDHRWNHSLERLNEIFDFNGCRKGPIDITPLSRKFNSMDLDNLRSDEIMMWVEENHPEKWVAVDDLDLNINHFREAMDDHFAQTLAGIHLVKERIIDMFNI